MDAVVAQVDGRWRAAEVTRGLERFGPWRIQAALGYEVIDALADGDGREVGAGV